MCRELGRGREHCKSTWSFAIQGDYNNPQARKGADVMLRPVQCKTRIVIGNYVGTLMYAIRNDDKALDWTCGNGVMLECVKKLHT